MPRRTTPAPTPYIPPEETDAVNINDIGITPQLFGTLTNIRTTAIPTTTTPPPPANLTSPIEPNGLVFTGNTHLSNGDFSRQVTGAAGINDFSIFNNYVHYSNSNATSPITFNPRTLLQESVTRFEVYRQKFRN